jgi:phage shock protein C
MKRFYRSYTDKKISGICSGLGRYTNSDPLLWRLGFLGLVFTPIPIILIYFALTLITSDIEYND